MWLILSRFALFLEAEFTARELTVLFIVLTTGATLFRRDFQRYLGKRGTTICFAFFMIASIAGLIGVSLKEIIVDDTIKPTWYGVYSVLYPSSPEIAPNAHFIEIHTLWLRLLNDYRTDDHRISDKLSEAVAALTPAEEAVLDIEQKREMELARAYVQGWKTRTRVRWNAIIEGHPADALTPLAQYEERQILPSAPAAYVPRTAASLGISDDVSRVYFYRGSTTINDMETVRKWASIINQQKNSAVEFRLGAYSNEYPDTKAWRDFGLSVERLHAVTSVLKLFGVDMDTTFNTKIPNAFTCNIEDWNNRQISAIAYGSDRNLCGKNLGELGFTGCVYIDVVDDGGPIDCKPKKAIPNDALDFLLGH